MQWRLRGTKSDEDEDSDTVLEPSSLRKIIKDTTGVEILANDDEFKSTYQILLEISKVWNKVDETGKSMLSDVEKAGLLEKIAGKHRTSAVAALLNDYSSWQRHGKN